MHWPSFRSSLRTLSLAVCLATFATAQVSVTTYHYDNSRTGQNVHETVLNPAIVNVNQFGKLFSTTVDGSVYAQPLYVPNVQNIAGGTHNVLYVATEHDSLYAIDADSGALLWRKSFINPTAGITTVPSSDVACDDLVPEIGITSTPVIDPATNTLYLVTKTKETGVYFQRLHAIDIVTNAEKFGGPIAIAATVNGTGDGSSGGKLSFDPLMQNNRLSLLLENGHVVIGWGAHCDNGPFHGWLMSYNASTLAQEAVFNTSPNSGLSGVWMGGNGPAADSGGNIYFATGNGTYDGAAKGDYGDSIMKLSGPTGGQFTVADWFTPSDQGALNNGDTDVASGGVLLLPDLPAGSSHPHLLVEMGKEGEIFLVDRDNMGKYCSGCSSDTQIVQEIPAAAPGVWGSPAYWNGWVYWGGAAEYTADHVKAFSLNANNSGMLSTSPTSQSSQLFNFSTTSPVVSSNGSSNGILWILDNSSYASSCCQVLYAFDATNLANMLYNSSQAPNSRDRSGGAVKFTSPIVANGKVYAGSQTQVTAWGVMSGTQTAATPTFNPATGVYTSSQSVTLSDTTPNATIYYTTDNSTPTTSSQVYSTPISVTATTTIKAFAAATGYNNSSVGSATYTISPGSSGINFGGGFTATGLTLNGSAALSGTRLRLTNSNSGGQAGSAFFNTPIAISRFTTDFSFQMSSAAADGMTFTIQNTAPTALGPFGGGLGYGPDTPGGTPGIAKSIAVKFDIYDNNGEGTDSTGLYLNGASPTTPAIDMTSSGVILVSGDVFKVHMTYDGTTLTMTITDATNAAQTFTTSWAVNIPSTVGSSSAYIGFTGGTGGLTAIQDIIDWTYASSASQPTVATPTFSPASPYTGGATTVTISDSTSGAAIFYCQDTTNTCTPTTAGSSVSFSSTGYIRAQATESGFTSSAIASWSGTYVASTAAAPTFSPPAGTYTSSQSVTLSDTTPNAAIYYTTDNSIPTTSSKVYSTAISVTVTTTIKAIAAATGYNNSSVASATYTISTGSSGINFGGGFTATGLTLNGNAALSGTRLRLTNGGGGEAGSAFFSTPIDISHFTTDFSFQMSVAQADGMTFTIQNTAPTALGPFGGGLGYGPDTPGGTPGIAKSIAVKFDIYSNQGEGTDSTGLYLNGASPTTPAIDMTSSGVKLLSGDAFNVHMTYDGTTLTMTITDATNAAQTFTTSWAVNIPSTVGSSNAYVGFTGGTGGLTAIQDLIDWTYASTTSQPTVATPTFSPASPYTGGATTVTISDSTSGAAIFYCQDTTNTCTPSIAGSSVSFTSTGYIRAQATESGFTSSAIASWSGTYVPSAVATPTFSPASPYTGGPTTVTISDSTSGAAIFYCQDTTNTCTPSTAGSSVSFSSTGYIRAQATKSGYTSSAIASWSGTYVPSTVATPTFSPASPYTGGATTVTISDSTSGAAIFYCQDTTNTCTPTIAGSSVSFSSTGYIRAQATESGYTSSAIASWSGTYVPPAAATPTFSPAPGKYSSPQSVTLSDTTPGATIYYTTDNSTPTTSSKAYSTPISLSSNTTIKAIAAAPGDSNSPVATGRYIIQKVH